MENISHVIDPKEFALSSLFMQAGIIPQSLTVLLASACLAACFSLARKLFALRRLNWNADLFELAFWSGRNLDELYAEQGQPAAHPMSAVFCAAMAEWRHETRLACLTVSYSGVRERIRRAMNVAMSREMEKLQRGLALLKSIGATTPMIGLFAAIIRIVQSVRDAAMGQDAVFSALAPGLATALLVLALGLLAAIPAIIAVTKINADLARLSARLEAFASEFLVLLSRQTEMKS